ncbi:phosphoglycerate mutase-like protein [Fomitopsis serialis]|uniref:phosphoglycerate mutase-like protein n=1 Tax=Fomitopsis serialis TaxID=139415 RepID=UPI0020081D1F|nr:phosphoglycerate mutase-like protein [Neoantrodia serialis]KAH9930745.1 phosphoglycerate mutase-like protein [Neoantrodia serialis]
MAAAAVLARIYIVRHGETNENRLGIMQGQRDTHLNAAGLDQAQAAAGALETVGFARAFSSDLDRAAKTAEIILQKHPGVLLEKHAALRERNLGDWEGQKLEGRRPTAPANAEQLSDFSLRAAQWWNGTILAYVESLVKQDPVHGKSLPADLLVVSHGGYISRLIGNLLGSGKMKCAEGVVVNGKCWNASISVIDILDSGEAVLVSYSDTAHLKVDLVQTNADVIDR